MFEELVARQAGVVSLAQATAHGYPASRVRRRVREGRWRRLHPGVVLVGGHRLTDEARVRAAWLWVGPSATVVGPAAAYWHGMCPRAPTSIETAVPSRMGSRRTAGVRVRRRDLPDADLTFVRGLRVTGLALTALETAVVLPDGSAFLDRALQKYVPFAEVYRAYCRSLGHRGSPDMCRLTGWVLGHPSGPYQIDVAFPEARVAVEIDGWAWHVDQDRFVGDRRKQNALVREGWTVLRFTWHDLTRAPHSVVAQIVAALERAA